MLNRSVAPAFNKIQRVNIQQAETHYLSNGIPVHLIKAGKQPVVKVECILHSGKKFESKDGVAFFTARMLNAGTRHRNASEMAHFIDYLGAYLEINAGYDYVTIAFYSLEKYVSKLIRLLKEILSEALFPEDELSLMQNMVSQDLKMKLEKSNLLAYKKFREVIFSGNPYGKDLEEHHIRAISRDDLREFYQQILFNNPEFILSGHFSDDVLKELEAQFGADHLNNIKSADFILDYNPARKVIAKEAASQSSIKIGKLLFNKNHPDYLDILIVNEILGGYFGSRLMKNIREEKGYTYGVYSRIMNFKSAGYFMIGADVKKEFTREAIAEIYREIRDLQENLVPEDELEMVRNQMLGSFLNEINSPFALAEKFKSVHYHGLGYDFYQHFVEKINHITSGKIMEISNKHLNLDSLTEIVVGNDQQVQAL